MLTSVKPNMDDSLATDKIRKARIVSSLLILILVLISLALLHLHRGGFWLYTWLMCIFVALLCIGLGIYLLVREKNRSNLALWRLILYWAGFLATLYINGLMLHYGVATPTQAGLSALLLLAAALYFMGIIKEIALALVGFTIALMVIGALVIHNYLLFVITPLAIVMSLLVLLMIKKNKPDSRDPL